MRRYYTGLLVLTLVMMLLAFCTQWFGMAFFKPLSPLMLPLAVLYFCIVDAGQYWFTLRSVQRSPKAFVQLFLATTVAVLFLHIVVLIAGMFSNPMGGKRFAIAFLVLYVVYTVYIIASLVRFFKNPRE